MRTPAARALQMFMAFHMKVLNMGFASRPPKRMSPYFVKKHTKAIAE